MVVNGNTFFGHAAPPPSNLNTNTKYLFFILILLPCNVITIFIKANYNCTYLSNHLKPRYWIKMDLKYLIHVSIPLWDNPQGAFSVRK